MAHFRATIKGARGEASRLGHKEITAAVNGWDIGVRVYGSKSHSGDIFSIYATGGSNGRVSSVLISTIIETPSGFRVEGCDSFTEKAS